MIMLTELDKCIEKLGASVVVFSLDESRNKIKKISEKIIFGISGIDWKQYPNRIDDYAVIFSVIAKMENKECYILWDEYSLPILKSDFSTIAKNIDDITIMAFDTFIIGCDLNWVLEFHHEGAIRFTFL